MMRHDIPFLRHEPTQQAFAAGQVQCFLGGSAENSRLH